MVENLLSVNTDLLFFVIKKIQIAIVGLLLFNRQAKNFKSSPQEDIETASSEQRAASVAVNFCSSKLVPPAKARVKTPGSHSK
jgi:hypothetical protein